MISYAMYMTLVNNELKPSRHLLMTNKLFIDFCHGPGLSPWLTHNITYIDGWWLILNPLKVTKSFINSLLLLLHPFN